MSIYETELALSLNIVDFSSQEFGIICENSFGGNFKFVSSMISLIFSAKERFEIFRQCLKGHDISGLDLKTLANSESVDFSGSDIQRSCSNAINRFLRRKVASKNFSKENALENRLTMKDMNECMKRVTPMSTHWRKKYDHWCKQI